MTYTSTRLITLQAVFSKKSARRLLALHGVSAACGLLLLILAVGCQSMPGQLAARRGDEIIIAGQMIHSGAPVTLWIDAGGYDGYRGHRHDEPEFEGPQNHPDRILRFGSTRRDIPASLRQKVQRDGWCLEDLTGVIDTVVLHYDACGSSSRCFHILHDIRGLSCHFLLDVDGTIYQTLDVKERAWHAGPTNDRSIGIEIAHFGAFSTMEKADTHYILEGDRIRLNPDSVAGTSAADAPPYPARDLLFEGKIHGQQLYQRDFTEAQYRSLESLLITLCRTLPRIEPVIPRLEDGSMNDRLRPEPPGEPVAGIVGHWHVGTHKVDPGPAFDWDRIEKALSRAGLNAAEID